MGLMGVANEFLRRNMACWHAIVKSTSIVWLSNCTVA